jgi:hypothetical protein
MPTKTVNQPTLATVDQRLRDATDLSPTRRRDLRSAVARVAALLEERPENLPLDLTLIASRLKTVNAVAAGMTAKRLSNIRSDFMAAVRVSGLQPVPPKAGLSAEWTDLMAKVPGKRARIGLSRLAHFASAAGITPREVNDAVLDQYIAEVRRGSLHQSPNALHRKTAVIWNEVADNDPELRLSNVSKPSFRGAPKRVDWAALTEAFRADVEKYLAWCEGADAFAVDARPRRSCGMRGSFGELLRGSAVFIG